LNCFHSSIAILNQNYIRFNPFKNAIDVWAVFIDVWAVFISPLGSSAGNRTTDDAKNVDAKFSNEVCR